MSRALAGGCYRYPLAAIGRQLSSWPKQINLIAAEPRPRDEGIAFSPLSKNFKVYPRAMHHSHNHEQNVGCSQYRSHEMTPGSSKEVEAGLSTLGTGHGHSYLKALLAAQYCRAPQFRVDGTKSTAYAQADFTEARCDALYPLAGGLGELHVEVGQPTIWGLPARQILVAGFVRNIGRSSIFSRGGPAYPGVSSLLRAQTRSYKTRMANRSIRDQKKRLLVQKYEMKRAHYKAICHDRSLSSQVRYDFALKLSKLPRNSSKTRLKNRCVFTGRSHSVYRKFGISRLVFRELASRGALTGVNKASW